MESFRNCPACGGGPTGPAIPGPPAILRCGGCGHYVLAEIPDRETREAGYQEEYYREGTADRFHGAFESASRLFRRLRARAIRRRFPRPGAILDVGCGRGVMLGLLRREGWRAVGTQISRTAAEAARKRQGVEVLVGELPGLELTAASFDAVTMFHVLEHLEDPHRYLVEARRLLRPGGLLLVEVPDHSGAGFRILGTRHLCLDHPNHLQFFTRRSLRALLERAGFRVESRDGFSLEYSPFTTLQNLLNLLPGEPNRLYRALRANREGETLRRDPATWLHFGLAAALAAPAFLLSLTGLAFPSGNTMRYLCRPEN